MDSGASRLIMAAAMLAGLWIVVYWVTPAPERSEQPPPITFEPAPFEIRDDAGQTQDEALPTIDPLAVDAHAEEAPAAVEPPEQRPVVIAPTFTSYTWKREDSLRGLAERFYGDPELAMIISKANPTVDMRKLRAGMVLRIPDDPDNIQGLDVDPVTGEVIAQAPDAIDRGLVTEYVVEKNDTLTGIAYALYGKASMWPIIRDANLHQLKKKDGSDIRPGMRLVIPPPPDLSAAGSKAKQNRN
ncbi:MAG: LysM peptidoglycan-binding domain-containing protein [Phycisphaeraceae bacterium]|nr:LysM peptidoglycan-binding domain-containing protein [Phycisphaeraceae bacterium]